MLEPQIAGFRFNGLMLTSFQVFFLLFPIIPPSSLKQVALKTYINHPSLQGIFLSLFIIIVTFFVISIFLLLPMRFRRFS
ncbi:unnamed protein product [Protopolystoma xenopodis]|uniref:Uncharacterized protein n=1 Tax=Protopolystoma xenopodis TaxID=117903 RepID=A0A448XSH9_9PLAT|nr:unnamed protein product [Protopolystoma xenopodis]